MKNIIILAVAFLVSSPCLFAQTKAGKVDTTKHATFYTCPMHAEVVKHQPGQCPKCGMALNLSSKEEMKAITAKNYTCPMHLDVASHNPAKCPKCGRKMNLSTKEQMKAEVMKTFTCPMHPEISLDKDGNCPKCGAALIAKEKNKIVH